LAVAAESWQAKAARAVLDIKWDEGVCSARKASPAASRPRRRSAQAGLPRHRQPSRGQRREAAEIGEGTAPIRLA